MEPELWIRSLIIVSSDCFAIRSTSYVLAVQLLSAVDVACPDRSLLRTSLGASNWCRVGLDCMAHGGV